MHYCPKCRYEYLTQVTICPDCGSTLVDGDEIPEVEKQGTIDTDENESVMLVESLDYLKLRFMLDLLDQEGIPYATRKFTRSGTAASSDLVAMAGAAASTVGGIARIYVAPEDYQRGLELWQSLEGSELKEDEEIDAKDET